MNSYKKGLSYVAFTIFALITLFSQSVIANHNGASNGIENVLLLQSSINQDSVVLYRIETKDGNVFIGEIMEKN